jgi:hypothetical protein
LPKRVRKMPAFGGGKICTGSQEYDVPDHDQRYQPRTK